MYLSQVRGIPLSTAGYLLAYQAILGLLLAPATARAHGIESSLTRLQALSDELTLESQFSSGEPTRDAVVRLVPPGGAPIEVGRTDARGQLSFALPKGASGDWEVQVDGGAGHRGSQPSWRQLDPEGFVPAVRRNRG